MFKKVNYSYLKEINILHSAYNIKLNNRNKFKYI